MKLMLNQKIELHEKSEKFRIFWNTDRLEDVSIFKNGKTIETKRLVHSLDIKIEDINPSTLYTDPDLIIFYSK